MLGATPIFCVAAVFPVILVSSLLCFVPSPLFPLLSPRAAPRPPLHAAPLCRLLCLVVIAFSPVPCLVLRLGLYPAWWPLLLYVSTLRAWVGQGERSIGAYQDTGVTW